jgi:hypothetical protein
MDPIGVKNDKPYALPRAAEPTTEAKSAPKSSGPTGNAVMDAVASPPTAEEKKSIADFALLAKKPPPQNAPAERAPIGHVLVGKLQSTPTWQELLDQARVSSNPNASIGPIAAQSKAVSGDPEHKECKAVVKTLGDIPIVGKALENELEPLCGEKAPATLGTLPNVPVEKPKATALPNTAKEGGDVPWKPISK